MKNGPLFLLGLFVALTLSWAGLILGPKAQLGNLPAYSDETDTYPARSSGLAMRGQLVYADLGCAACHTQQVRRPDFGSDQARGWGDRQSVARDYIFQLRPQLGGSRIGPDLANLAGRKPSAPDAEDLLKLLYAGSPAHPAYKFLFEDREIVGERSAKAMKLTGNLAADEGHEIVPTVRAENLVAYLLSLNNGFDYPESRPANKAKAGEGAAAKKDEKAATAPAAAPATAPAATSAPAPMPAPAGKQPEAKK